MPNNKPSVLLICNTPFQIMMACHIAMLYYKDYDIDITISEGIKGGETLAQNAQNVTLFRRVFFIKNKKTFLSSPSFLGRCKYVCGRIREVWNNWTIAKNLAKNKYDACLFSNISILTKLFTSILKKHNPNVHLAIFEEGLVTYTRLYSSGDAPTSLYRRFIDRMGLLTKIDTLYLCHPYLLEWDLPNGTIVHLQPINKNNTELIVALNTIFDYNQCEDVYDKRIVFFEESHVFEGFDVPDVDIVNQIANVVGKEEIMIKIHPRNPENRFSKLGFKTNKNTSIPWEVILLNQSFDNKIFVTISSGAVVSPYLYLGIPCVTYSLLNCLSKRPGFMQSDLGDMMQRVYKEYKDIFKAPKTIDQFIAQL